MKIVVTACQVPFIFGGATHQFNGLVDALREHGHAVELIRFPFQFSPPQSIRDLMRFCEELDLTCPNGQSIDRVISLQFPGYAVRHPHHVVWVMHQYRAVYELFDAAAATPEMASLRAHIHDFDKRVLGAVHYLFAESARVAERLQHFNGLSAEPLAHPPALAEHFRWAPPQPYIFCPSRLESLKRQDLLIEAACHLRSPVAIVIAGTGGQDERYRRMIEARGLQQRVRLIGHITEAEKIAYYANALGVFFAPFDEDYGYITLEAMLSAKPVITCFDSGGPLEFVLNDHTGCVVSPEAKEVAAAIDTLHAHPERSRQMGEAGREHYRSLGISWQRTVSRLLAA